MDIIFYEGDTPGQGAPSYVNSHRAWSLATL